MWKRAKTNRKQSGKKKNSGDLAKVDSTDSASLTNVLENGPVAVTESSITPEKIDGDSLVPQCKSNPSGEPEDNAHISQSPAEACTSPKNEQEAEDLAEKLDMVVEELLLQQHPDTASMSSISSYGCQFPVENFSEDETKNNYDSMNEIYRRRDSSRDSLKAQTTSGSIVSHDNTIAAGTNDSSDDQSLYFEDERMQMKIKSRMSIYSSFNILEDLDKTELSVETNNKSQDDKGAKAAALIRDFVKSELGYFRCVTYLANFEMVLSAAMLKPKTPLSKSEYNKLALNYGLLQSHTESYKEILEFKCSGDNAHDIGTISDFMFEVSSTKLIYKNITLNMDRLISTFTKHCNNDRFRSLYSPEIYVEEWGEAVNFLTAVDKVYRRTYDYINFLYSLIDLTEVDSNTHKNLRDTVNHHIVLWDVLQLCRISRRAPNISRTLTISTPVVQMVNKGRRYMLLLIFMDTLVIVKGTPNDTVVKGILPLKKCACYRESQTGFQYSNEDERKFKHLTGEIVHMRDYCVYLETKAKKVDHQKLEKAKKKLLELKYQHLLASHKHPLTITNNKNSITFLFRDPALAYEWEYVINCRSKFPFMDSSVVSLNEAQCLTNEVFSKLTKEPGANLSNIGSTFIETPNDISSFKVNDTTTSESTPSIPKGWLVLNITLNRYDLVTNDIYYKLYCDHYMSIFEKRKSTLVKLSESGPNVQVFLLKVEDTRMIRLDFMKSKSQTPIFQTNPISLSHLSLPNDSFHRFKIMVDKIATVVVYAMLLPPSEAPPALLPLTCIDHFQPSIEEIVQCEGVQVPDVVRICVEQIENIGLSDVGIYRLSGSTNRINQLHGEFASNAVLIPEDTAAYDIHDLTGLFKSFFRDLKVRLIPFECVENFNQWDLDPNKNRHSLDQTVNSLPTANRSTFYFLMKHLCKVVHLAPTNKMTSANVSTVFAPNIFGEPKTGDQSHQTGLFRNVTIFKNILDVFYNSVDLFD